VQVWKHFILKRAPRKQGESQDSTTGSICRTGIAYRTSRDSVKFADLLKKLRIKSI